MVLRSSSLNFLFLLLGLAGLWLGTDLTIRGAVSVAKILRIPEFIVGVAILSVGSDLPELTIAISGAVQNLQGGSTSDVIVGSAIGSSLGQIGFVLGIVGLVGYLTLPKHIIFRHGGVMMGALVVLALVGMDGTVSRTEGASLVTIYLVYFASLFTEKSPLKEPGDTESSSKAFRSWFYILFGLAVVGASAEMTVRAATQVSDAMNIEQSLVAIIVIGLGTSLPELSISLGAIMKKRTSLSVGNLIGSNIFDTLMPVGVAAAISTLHFDAKMLRFDLPFLFVLSGLVLFFFVHKKGLQKTEAATILALYCAYVLLRLSII